jgi:hypothetical protein
MFVEQVEFVLPCEAHPKQKAEASTEDDHDDLPY